MKFFGGFFLVLFSSFLFSQTENLPLVVRTFVKQDTVLLRWAPTSADIMIKGLQNGYKIERIEGSESFENNPTLQIFSTRSFKENKSEFLNSSDKNVREMVAFVDELATSSSLNTTAKSMSFAVLMLGAGTNKEIAKMLGIYFEDLTTKKSNYTYRISINQSSEISSETKINSAVLSENQTFTVLVGSSRPKLKQTYLSWEAKTLQAGYSAYWIERSTDSINFEKRNNTPYLFLKSTDEPNKTNCDFVDTGVTEGATYFYRITGINHFAEKGKSSNIVKVYVPKSLYGECRIDSVVANGLNRKLTGHFVPRIAPGTEQGQRVEAPDAEIRFVLFRSDSLNFGYQILGEQINQTNTFVFDAKVGLESGDRYYYKVAALSADNDTVFSFPYYFFTLDQIPPQVPQGLAGIVNDSGVVSLTWKLNDENDIQGYRVYRSNDLKEEFVEVTKFFCEDSVFYDTLSLDNLTSKVYYKIAAVDLNFNNSKKTAPVLLLKPDTIPPVASIITSYLVKPEGLELTWINSSSNDLGKSVLLRKSAGEIVKLFFWEDTTSRFLDTSCVAGITYEYSIIATDHSKNLTESTALNVNYETGIRDGISDIKSTVDREEKFIELNWILPDEEIYSIQIYRAKNDEPFRLIETIREKNITTFIDKDLSINNTYKYKIKVVYKSGISSVLSDEIKIVY